MEKMGYAKRTNIKELFYDVAERWGKTAVKFIHWK
ncbi:hypothetical protein SAMN05216352_1286 [Alteribacillus bidgolensis]|uniref:Uncharacterized protein n=1 Tax=Alteribacillus bidgolensis TaxID=930129 RepID=A0A1G8RIM3_9BACI|nr:hypothetical protein SAMN05216352_1286 [Alteribacillus bidgolensis]